MNEREIIKQVSVESKIYDLGLVQMVKRVFEEDMLSLEKDIHFGLDVVFNKCVYQEAAFYQYPVPKETKGPKPRTERERHKQMIYDVLGEQLDKITSALEQVGLRFGHVSVIGDDLDGDSVQIILYREPPLESSGPKKQTVAHVTSIMPDRPYIIEQASKVFAEMVLKQMREDKLKEIARKNHTPNWVLADKLFSAVAAVLAAENMDVTATKMLSEAVVESDWPLHMRSRCRTDQTEVLTRGTQIDCPEYMLIRLNHGGSWEIKKVEGLKEAQQVISRQGFRNKQTKTIIVLQNLESVPYLLFAETDEGLVSVLRTEADKYKKLHVSWSKSE